MERLAGKDKKAMLLSELKTKYIALCKDFRPVPWMRDRECDLQEIFVQNHLERYDNTVTSKIFGNTWQSLQSYKTCFTYADARPTMRILEGPAGFGKSFLTLKLAHDWCKGGRGSPIGDVEILILLQLRHLRGVESFGVAIQRLLLSRDCKLNQEDIAQILEEASSVAVILDDYEEYLKHNGTGSDFERIAKGEMLDTRDVTITVKRTPPWLPESTQRVRLAGFDDGAREQYTRWVVGSYDDAASLQIRRWLFLNPVIADILNVPLTFAMFVHVAHSRHEFPTFRSVTAAFRYIVMRIHDSADRCEGEDSKSCKPYEANDTVLDKLAFESLGTEGPQIPAWSKDEIRRQLGPDSYEHYVYVGILIEEDVLDNEVDCSTEDSIQPTRAVRFCHGLFGEWYAAFHVATHVLTYRDADLQELLRKIDPCEHPYLYRFTCGLDPNAAKKIINFLKGNKDHEKFSILCILEQTGSVDGVRAKISQLFRSEVQLWPSSNDLSQRSTLELMEIAARHDIEISSLALVDCRPRIDPHRSEDRLYLESGLSVPLLQTLQQLVVNESRLLSTGELSGIMTYSSRCNGLKKLMFLGCKLPKSVATTPAISALRSRKVEVMCDPGGVGIRLDYQYLNLETGQWEGVRERRKQRTIREAKLVAEPLNNNIMMSGEEDANGSKRCIIA